MMQSKTRFFVESFVLGLLLSTSSAYAMEKKEAEASHSPAVRVDSQPEPAAAKSPAAPKRRSPHREKADELALRDEAKAAAEYVRKLESALEAAKRTVDALGSQRRQDARERQRQAALEQEQHRRDEEAAAREEADRGRRLREQQKAEDKVALKGGDRFLVGEELRIMQIARQQSDREVEAAAAAKVAAAAQEEADAKRKSDLKAALAEDDEAVRELNAQLQGLLQDLYKRQTQRALTTEALGVPAAAANKAVSDVQKAFGLLGLKELSAGDRAGIKAAVKRAIPALSEGHKKPVPVLNGGYGKAGRKG